MNIIEAIKKSIELENKIKQIYLDGLNQLNNPIGEKLFKTLIKDEQRHIDYLEHKLKEIENLELNLNDIESNLPYIVDITKLNISKSIDSKNNYNNELNLLYKVLEVEKETTEFYNSLVNTLDKDAKKLFNRFVDIEQGHLAIIQAQIDYITGTGFWFDIKEFDLES